MYVNDVVAECRACEMLSHLCDTGFSIVASRSMSVPFYDAAYWDIHVTPEGKDESTMYILSRSLQDDKPIWRLYKDVLSDPLITS